jgi:hypothetical protein
MHNLISNPFRLTTNELWDLQNIKAYRLREKRICDFLGKNILLLISPFADMGESNPLKIYIQNKFKIQIDSLDGDFDFYIKNPQYNYYNTIFHFDVLEHLMNPLTNLIQLNYLLPKDGIVFLSTPYRPRIFWSKYHFHEIDDYHMKILLERAGFEIIKMVKIPMRGRLINHIYGIRPIIRYFLKTRFYVLRKYKEIV